jgi:hypothetical protein
MIVYKLIISHLLFRAAFQGYLKGNETKFEDAMYEMENIRSRYLECRMTFDYACIEEIEQKRQIKQKEIMAKFNMTIEEYVPFVSIT